MARPVARVLNSRRLGLVRGLLGTLVDHRGRNVEHRGVVERQAMEIAMEVMATPAAAATMSRTTYLNSRTSWQRWRLRPRLIKKGSSLHLS